jgi:site-specific DNA-methyltransferase (adenine-specific)
VCCDWRSWPSIWDGFKARLSPKNLVVWDKGGSGLGSNYANAYELIGFFARLPPARTMKSSEERGQRPVHKPNLKRRNPMEPTPLELAEAEQVMRRFNRPHGEDRNHNAAKPVDLFAWFIENSSDEGAVVLDCFAGGGACIEACERLNRSARLIEREPDTADLIVARWVKLTGGTPERVPGFVEAHAHATIPSA